MSIKYVIEVKKPGQTASIDWSYEFASMKEAQNHLTTAHFDEMDDNISLEANRKYDYDSQESEWRAESDRLWAELIKSLEDGYSWEDGNGVNYRIIKLDNTELVNHLIDLLNECASNCSIEGHYYGPNKIWLDLEMINQACSDYGLTEQASEELSEDAWDSKVRQAAQWLAEDLV